MTQTINFAPLSDVNPYVFGSAWTVLQSNFKVLTGAARPVSDTINPFVVLTNPPTSGVLDVTFVTNGTDAIFNDYVNHIFVTGAMNGYCVEIHGDRIRIKPVTAGVVGSTIGTSQLIAYVSGETFRATYTIATDTIDVYQHSVSTTVPQKTVSGLTFITGMSSGIMGIWSDSNLGGAISLTSEDIAFSVDTITASIQHGGSGTFTYTGLGTITAMTVDGVNVPTVSGTGGSGTFTMPSRVDGAVIAGHGSKTVVITGTLGSASTTMIVAEAAAQQYVAITSLGSGVGALATYYAILTTDEITSDTPATLGVTTNNVGADTIGHWDFAGTQTIWWWKASTKVVTQIYVINGVIVSGGLTRAGITGAITTSGITS